MTAGERTGDGPGISWRTRCRRWAWLLAWNLAGVGLGVAVLLAAGEVWLRLTLPFVDRSEEGAVFRPGVGYLFAPGAEVRHTNLSDFWSIQRANSLGFLDREPPEAARAAAACHVAVMGDSFVEASEVAVADKVHVRLEALAAERLPGLDVVTTAFGRYNTGQFAQLAYYDHYVRALAPKLVVIVFFKDDFDDNYTPLGALRRNKPPAGLPFLAAARDEHGAFYLRPPLREGPYLPPIRGRRWTFLGFASDDGNSLVDRALLRVQQHSWVVRWLGKKGMLRSRPQRDVWEERLAKSPELRAAFSDLSWVSTLGQEHEMLFARRELPSALAEGLEYTAFALAEFVARARRDGFALVVLATEHVGGADAPMFQRLDRLTRAAQIDLVDLHDYIVRHGGRLADAQWREDWHWNPTGHRWAAEALFEYLAANQDVCAGRERASDATALDPDGNGT